MMGKVTNPITAWNH